MRQFIIEKQKINNGLVVLEGKDFRYLRQVLRVKVGDMMNLRLPNGSLENSTVALIDEKSRKITLQICGDTGSSYSNVADNSTGFGKGKNSGVTNSGTITRGVQADEIESQNLGQKGIAGIEYWLFQFIPKPQKFEQIVRQATECGISKIVPIIGEYTEKSSVLSLQGSKKERIERIIKEARQQSGSPIDTKVLAPMTLEEGLEVWEAAGGVAGGGVSACAVEGAAGGGEPSIGDESVFGFVLSERDDCSNNLRNIISIKKEKNIKIEKIGIAVGSEGGLSPEEVQSLQEKGLFYPIHFTVNILRCETAAVYGIAAVQSAVN